VNRRDFIKAASVTAAAILTFPRIVRSRKDPVATVRLVGAPRRHVSPGYVGLGLDGSDRTCLQLTANLWTPVIWVPQLGMEIIGDDVWPYCSHPDLYEVMSYVRIKDRMYLRRSDFTQVLVARNMREMPYL
jgi:hypothetical protein